jgi:hypothetical protein
LDTLLLFESLHHETLTSIAEISCVQMCSVHPEIRERYSIIFAKLPLQYGFEQVNYPTGINQEISEKITELEHWNLSKESGAGTMRSQYFKEFIEATTLSRDYQNTEESILRAFTNCWFLDDGLAMEFKVRIFIDFLMGCLFRVFWSQKWRRTKKIELE